ncbi:MAG: cyanophycin synthetase, partial [candidate division WOR-3 bacterium]
VNDVVVEEVKFYTDRTSFKVNSPWGNVEVCIGLLGLHNVKNATASITVSALLGIPLEKAAESLGSFKGVERRLTIVGEKKGITLIDDYAHHPTEVKSTLSAIRQRWKDNRVIAIFQPHRYSRMSLLWEEFLNSFHLADEVWVTGVYSAGEVPGGFDMDLFVKKLRDLHGCVRFYESWKDMVDPILSYLKYGDVVVTLGAGDVGKLCKELLKHL